MADTAAVSAGMVVLALATGFAIGLAVYGVMNLSTWLTALLWNGATGDMPTPWFPLAICGLGGVVIGLWTWFTGDVVHSLEEVMAEFRETGGYRVDGPVKPVVSFLLPLVFGGSIGLEAGLTGLVTAGACWIRDKLKAAGLRASAIADATIAASLAAIFGTPIAGIVAGAESAPDDGRELLEHPCTDGYTMRRGAKVVLYTAAAFGALGGISLLTDVFGLSSTLPRFGGIEFVPNDVLWVLPCLVLAYLMALAYHATNRLTHGITQLAGASAVGIIGRPVVAGLVLGGIACAFPFVLFPGEAQSEFLMDNWAGVGAVALLATAVLKAVVTPMCLNMGWVGGNFFPSIFAGVAAGYGVALLTGADAMLLVTVTTAAFLAGVIRRPLLVVAVLFLCFPVESAVWMGIAAIVGAILPLPHVLMIGEGD